MLISYIALCWRLPHYGDISLNYVGVFKTIPTNNLVSFPVTDNSAFSAWEGIKMNRDKNLCKYTIKTETNKTQRTFSDAGNLFRKKLLLKINVQHTYGGKEWRFVYFRCKCQGNLWIAVYRLQCTRKYLQIHFLSHYNTPCRHTNARHSTIFIEIIAVYLKKLFLWTKPLWAINAVFNTVSITVPTTSPALIRYRLLGLELAPLCLQQH